MNLYEWLKLIVAFLSGVMELSEWLTLIAVVLNIVTLAVVVSQTKIAKRSFDISAESYNKDKQIREITLLPKMHFLIHTKIKFDQWLMTLSQIKNELEVIEELNEYIKDAIPDVILSTPESISDDSFLSEK